MNTRRLLPVLALLPFVAACADIEAGTDPATGEANSTQLASVVTPEARPQVAAPVAIAPAPTPAVVVTPAPLAGGLAPPPAAEAEPVPVSNTPAAPAPAGRLGTTVASLGSPTSPGLWLETALVAEPTSGRVEYNGQTVTVELRPSGGEPGSGSQISLEAMRALGAPLTGLPELTVYGS